MKEKLRKSHRRMSKSRNVRELYLNSSMKWKGGRRREGVCREEEVTEGIYIAMRSGRRRG